MLMNITRKDKEILRRLADEMAAIAEDPVNDERRKFHEQVDRLERSKPTIHIYQIPWHEMDVDGELTLQTEHPFCRGIEENLRRVIYQWRHMPGDVVVDPVIHQFPAVNDSGFGIGELVDVAKTDDKNDVVSRHFHIQIADYADIEKIRTPEVSFDAQATEAEFMAKQEIFNGVVRVEKTGISQFWFAPWDELVRLTGVQEILMDMVLRPEYVHAIIDRFVTAWLHRLDQYESLGLLARPAMELWGVGAAQIFSEVSPAMHEAFALRHEARWFSRFGKNYYGCCEPLHNKVGIVRANIPRLKKISMSPWVDFDRAVENVGSDIIFAWKPNPAYFASEQWDPDFVRKDLREKLEKSKECIVEVHLKDISTVRYDPRRLWDWAKIAAEETARVG